MTTTYRLDDAQALLPEARRRIADAAAMLADLRRLKEQARSGHAPASAVEEIKVLERGVQAVLDWFDERGIQVKGIEPALLDFPAQAVRDGRTVDVLLCWRDDEDAIAFYHPPEAGYRGREPVAMLDQV